MEDVKLQNTKQILDRREFMGVAAAMAAIGAGVSLPTSTAMAAKGPSTGFTRWLDSINGTHKIVLDMREPNHGEAFAWAWVWLYTAPQAYEVPESDVGVALVLRHNAIPIALGDSAWEKYKLGEVFGIDDPDTGKPAVKNPFYLTISGEGFLPDMAIQKLIGRGVAIAACDMAIHHYSGVIAKKAGLPHEDVLADWNKAVLPGITHAPSGLVACQGAVSRGCTYLYAG